MNIHTPSVLKGGIAAALLGSTVALLFTVPLRSINGTVAGPDPIGLILGLLSAMPVLSCLLVPLLCASFVLLPLGAGLGYGYLSPSEHSSTDSLLGGGLTGAFGGLIYGLIAGLASLVINSGAAVFLQDVAVVPKAVSNIIGVIVSAGLVFVGGLIFGAIGGALWPVFGRRSIARGMQERSPLAVGLGGCSLLSICSVSLVLCAALTIVADASYWRNSQHPIAVAQALSTEERQAEFVPLPVGNASNGEQVFVGEGGCHACHSLDSNNQIIGPSLSGIAVRAAATRPDYSAEMYLYESIVNPNAYIVAGFQGGIMPAGFGQRLSEQQLADLIEFLMTK